MKCGFWLLYYDNLIFLRNIVLESDNVLDDIFDY